MKIILASSSLRRYELMKLFHVPFEVKASDIEETSNKELDCYQQCMEIAYKKARSIYEKECDDVLVIGSDTVVLMDNVIYGKPKDYQEAFQMIKSFNGRCHEVVSSLCVMIRKNKQEYLEKTYDSCKVYVSKMHDEEIKDWIENNDVYTRAGAYAIQDGFSKFVEKIDGDYFSIVGLPVHKLYEILKKYDMLK